MDGSTAAQAATRLTGQPAGSARPVGGSLFLIELADGREVVVKEGAGENASEAEAASLMWLADSGTVRVPEVYGHDERWLVMEPVPGGSPSQQAAEQLGRDLAAMHDAGAPAFGAPPPGGPVDAWIGLTSMINETGEDWPDWYASKRIEPYLRKAADSGAMDPAGVAAVAEVCERVGELAGPPEAPSRLHGDLWSGNVMWSTPGAWLIDPAAHGGHRETDLAMLQLFGCAQLERVLGAYDEHSPLADGWRDRVPLHQLFPLMVHVVLFGGGYVGQAQSAARKALRCA
jgi:fructosamine-3-kinase